MSESRHHKGLVLRAVIAISTALSEVDEMVCLADEPSLPHGRPPLIEGFRPDVYAKGGGIEVVGEAKPPWDVETPRSERQLEAFIRHVEQDESRHLVLAVHWTTASTAKSVLRSLANDWPEVRNRVHILDGNLHSEHSDRLGRYAPRNRKCALQRPP